MNAEIAANFQRRLEQLGIEQESGPEGLYKQLEEYLEGFSVRTRVKGNEVVVAIDRGRQITVEGGRITSKGPGVIDVIANQGYKAEIWKVTEGNPPPTEPEIRVYQA